VTDEPEAEADTSVETLSFEKAMRELETIVDKLERGEVSLEESIAIYERGEALKKRCENLLQSAEMKIETIRRSRDGGVAGSEPLDLE
jgi:exodeoxyribonuclease VII small subunit